MLDIHVHVSVVKLLTANTLYKDMNSDWVNVLLGDKLLTLLYTLKIVICFIAHKGHWLGSPFCDQQ